MRIIIFVGQGLATSERTRLCFRFFAGVGFIGRNIVHYLVSNDLANKVQEEFESNLHKTCMYAGLHALYRGQFVALHFG